MFLSSLSSVSVCGAGRCAQPQAARLGTMPPRMRRAKMAPGSEIGAALTSDGAVRPGRRPDEVISTSGTQTSVHLTDHFPRPSLDRLHCRTAVKYVNTF
jgi:hypothetical protein